MYLKLFHTQFDQLPYSALEYFLFVVLGVICGMLGALFVGMVTWLWRMRQTIKILRTGFYIPVLCVAFITAAISFPGAPFLKVCYLFAIVSGCNPYHSQKTQASNIEAISLFFSRGAITYVSSPLLHLSLFVVAKSMLTSAALVLPIPSGAFTPSFIIGGGLGRLVGEFIKAYIYPGLSTTAGFAVVGAAGLL